jgi:transposase
MEGPTAHGFGTPLWTVKRVRVFIEREFGVRYSDAHVWRLLGQMA